ncbi:MAG: NAD(P)H-hydrate dehydratase [Lachnospiraceae bacterium]|nr:NAD(P)H-hydrate dehydratase [Lachnospiraceae bacterium]
MSERIVTQSQMRALEKRIMDEVGLESPILMERAAMAARSAIEALGIENKTAMVFCGPGNNGGDGLALARMLTEAGWECACFLLADPEKCSGENKRQQRILERLFGPSYLRAWPPAAGQQAEVYVDALFGIGQNRGLSGIYREAAAFLNAAKGRKVALDIPSGIHADTGIALADQDGERVYVRADLTVTFGCRKSGLMLSQGKAAAGRIVLDSCGIAYPDTTDVSSVEGVKGSLPDREDLEEILQRDPLGNKGSFGKVVLWAGGQRATGAALLCTRSCFAAGAGYVKLLSYEDNRQLVLGQVPETVFLDLKAPGKKDMLLRAAEFADVIAMGCGVGIGEDAAGTLEDLCRALSDLESWDANKLPVLILDADVLTILSAQPELWEKLKALPVTTVMTPHMIEFSRLCKLPLEEIAKDRLSIAMAFAKEHQTILVLKDAGTLIASPDGRFSISPYGNDGMAVAGSGDSLLGILAAVMGRKKDPFGSVVCGVFLHGMAGDQAADTVGRASMLPTDLTGQIGAALSQILTD